MKHVFQFAPGAGSALLTTLLILLLVAVPAVIAAYLFYAPRNIRYEVSPGLLAIRGDLFYGRTLHTPDLLLAQAHVIDLERDTDFRLALRTNGTALPGYKSGWFRLRNGQKALAFIGDPHRVACIPTRAGYTLLLSAQDPEKLIESLRNP